MSRTAKMLVQYPNIRQKEERNLGDKEIKFKAGKLDKVTKNVAAEFVFVQFYNVKISAMPFSCLSEREPETVFKFL
jgi:hypothetical protein